MKTCCICQMIKDECDYISEWIEYHHNIGVDKFYLIEDINSISHKDLLNKYDYVELYKFVDIINDNERKLLESGCYRQRIIYEIFRRKWFKEYDYLIFIDVDEFLELDKNSLLKLLVDSENYPYIFLKWKNMKCDGNIYHPNNGNIYSVVNTYKSYNFKIVGSKVIVNCKYYDLLTNENFSGFPHQFAYNIKYLDKSTYLRHYLCKSFEEWVNRLTNKGEITKADWNRKFDDWFITNSEYRDRKDELFKEFGCDNLKIKYNDYVHNNSSKE